MNKQLQDFARKTLKEGLAALTDDNLDVFRRMYSPKELMKSLDKVIDDIPEEKLD